MITLTNKSGASVSLNEIGAGIISVIVPDKDGNMADVALGYHSPSSYLGDGPCMGKIPGRFANRIAFGKFTIGGVMHQLNINNGPNHLHGGPNGYANKFWTLLSSSESMAIFTLSSQDGDEHYPGELKVKATYTWTDNNVLTLVLSATTSETTIVNLTNHTYWNLAGENSGSVLNHDLRLFASNWLPTDDTLIPTGEIASVDGTPMDFTTAKPLGRDIKADFPALKYGKGYDNCWVVDEWSLIEEDVKGTIVKTGAMCEVGVLSEKTSGRTLTIRSTQPGVQIYTGNWLAGSPLSKSERIYKDYDGVAIECQGFPDSPNKSNFPSPFLYPGEEYRQIIEFTFGVLS